MVSRAGKEGWTEEREGREEREGTLGVGVWPSRRVVWAKGRASVRGRSVWVFVRVLQISRRCRDLEASAVRAVDVGELRDHSPRQIAA